jgi:putative transposase
MPQITPRRKNVNEPGHAHALTFSCFQRQQFLRSERTCGWLADSIELAREKFDFSVWAYVFMPEHVHLIVWPRQIEYEIAEIRKAIKASVARRAICFVEAIAPDSLSLMTRKRGNKTERLFWQSGGGYDRNLFTAKALIAEIDYLHLNPVRRGLVERPDLWKWSTAGWFLNSIEPPLKPDPIPREWLL